MHTRHSIYMLVALLGLIGCGESATKPDANGGLGGGGGGGNGDPGLAVMERVLIPNAFGIGFSAASSATDAITIAVQGVFVASELNGGQATTTGTLAQSAPDGGFTYSPVPSDRLIVDAAGFPTFEITIQAFEGYTAETWEDFRNFHSDLQFSIAADGIGQLGIASASSSNFGRGTSEPHARRITDVSFARTLTGTLDVDDVAFTVDLEHEGQWRSEFSGGILSFETHEAVTGTTSWADGAIDVAETYQYDLFDDRGVDVQNMHRRSESSGVVAGHTYAYSDVYVRSEHVNNAINRPEYWLAQGTLTRDGETYGTVRFGAPVLMATAGPEAVLELVTGETILLGGVLAE